MILTSNFNKHKNYNKKICIIKTYIQKNLKSKYNKFVHLLITYKNLQNDKTFIQVININNRIEECSDNVIQFKHK